MTTLCDEMLAPGNLTAAWRRYRGHRGLWSPGAPMNAVRREPVEALLRLADVEDALHREMRGERAAAPAPQRMRDLTHHLVREPVLRQRQCAIAGPADRRQHTEQPAAVAHEANRRVAVGDT